MNRNITATILLVLAGALYFTYTKGIWMEAQDVKTVNDQYVSAISNAERLITLRKKANDDYNSITADDREKLDKMIPDTVDNIRLIIDLNNVGVQNGLSLKNITASAKSSSGSASGATSQSSSGGFGKKDTSGINIPNIDTVGVSFSVSATYQQFINLMQALEANMRIMDLTHLSVTANDTGTYDFSVQLNTYYLHQ
ncbi:MAG: hypothetical protein V4524_02320 [Patescibacteria group bacterium]